MGLANIRQGNASSPQLSCPISVPAVRPQEAPSSGLLQARGKLRGVHGTRIQVAGQEGSGWGFWSQTSQVKCTGPLNSWAMFPRPQFPHLLNGGESEGLRTTGGSHGLPHVNYLEQDLGKTKHLKI
jgi:hypothetical protein